MNPAALDLMVRIRAKRPNGIIVSNSDAEFRAVRAVMCHPKPRIKRNQGDIRFGDWLCHASIRDLRPGLSFHVGHGDTPAMAYADWISMWMTPR